jgi:hypothetical protein
LLPRCHGGVAQRKEGEAETGGQGMSTFIFSIQHLPDLP